ncbi:MAG: hypothetical protein M5U32_21965 [Myxococcota bacterium]|nr:hypothetical protein [Myxococcota bacterium]PWB61719.1 MAG: hypothetical protein C3F17_12305 [Bradyrhizobiaceae bacterium]
MLAINEAGSGLRALTVDELDLVSGGKKKVPLVIVVEKCTETKTANGTVQKCKVISESYP